MISFFLQVPAAVVLEAMAAYVASADAVAAHHVGLSGGYPADLDIIIAARRWPATLYK
jgi:hypothetical protein